MPATTMDAVAVIRAAGLEPTDALIAEVTRMMHLSQRNPPSIVVQLLQLRRQSEQLGNNVTQAAGAAEELQKMLTDLLTASVQLYRFEAIRRSRGGTRVVCRSGLQLQEFPVHPQVNLEQFARLAPWDYVCVSERVVVDVWCDDPYLRQSAQGEVVDFKNYADREQHSVRVARQGGEEVVTLAGKLRDGELPPRSKLVLLRDNPRLAIAALPADHHESKFEVPLDQITTRLSDLACMEKVAEKLMLDVLIRILRPDIRKLYDLRPLRGMLLYSHKPGSGKTSFMRAFARWLWELGQKIGFDVVLYIVPPNSIKSMWHGEDSRIVREEIFGAIRARAKLPRQRPLLQLLVMDEFESLGRRPESGDRVASAAQSDAVQSFLAEMDGMLQHSDDDAHLLVAGMSNRPDMIDMAIKRPGRMGDLVVEIPDLDLDGAEKVCSIYARSDEIPFQYNGKPEPGAGVEKVTAKLIRPALAKVFPAVVLRYATDTQKKFDITAGQILAGVNYEEAMNSAKTLAANRKALRLGTPGVTLDDVHASLVESAHKQALAMQADPSMLIRELQLKVPVVSVEAVAKHELESHLFVKDQP